MLKKDLSIIMISVASNTNDDQFEYSGPAENVMDATKKALEMLKN